MTTGNKQLVRARLQAGITQEDLERSAGVSQSLISALERGRCPESVRIALRIARALNSTVEDLFGPYAASLGRRRKRRTGAQPDKTDGCRDD